MIPQDPHSGRGRPPPTPNTQSDLRPGAGRKRPVVGTQTLVTLKFLAVVAPLILGQIADFFICVVKKKLKNVV